MLNSWNYSVFILSGQCRINRQSENMLLLVSIIIAYVPTEALIHNIVLNGTTHDVNPEDINKNLRPINYPITDKLMKTHRNCTSLDVYCLPICCEPDPHRNRWACYANTTFSLMRDIDFSGKRDCNLSVLNVRSEELNIRWKNFYELDYESQYEIAFYLLDNGTIYENYSTNDDRDSWFDVDDYYCLVSGVTEDGSKSVDAVCFPRYTEKLPSIEINIIYVISTVMALPFLAATYLVYTILPKIKSVHGLTIRAYVASLSVMFVSLIISTISRGKLCAVVVFFIYFSSVACFSWVNVMTFDIWQTFRTFRAVQICKKQSRRRKFIMYSVFAWGSATFFTCIIAAVDYIPYVPNYFIKPGLGVRQCCVFGSFAARALYMFLPTGISLIVNICLFTLSMKTINKQTKEITYCLEGPDSQCHSETRERFNFTAKLATMMFINWLMEMINYLCEHESLLYFWALMDLTNVLQGFAVFVIFVWTDKTRQQLFNYLGLEDKYVEDENVKMRNNDISNNNKLKIAVIKY